MLQNNDWTETVLILDHFMLYFSITLLENIYWAYFWMFSSIFVFILYVSWKNVKHGVNQNEKKKVTLFLDAFTHAPIQICIKYMKGVGLLNF